MTKMKLKIPFSPPDMSEEEAKEVREALLSGWITTGPRTKKLEAQISEYVGTARTVCLSSATAAMEMMLHLLHLLSRLQQTHLLENFASLEYIQEH